MHVFERHIQCDIAVSGARFFERQIRFSEGREKEVEADKRRGHSVTARTEGKVKKINEL